MEWIAVVGAVLFFVGILASIALHEIGHLVPAKLFDVRTTQYMVGFGKTLWSRKRGETEYGIKLLPFGGYVRMIGMFPPARDGRIRRSSTGPFQTLMEEARRASAEDTPPDQEHRLFYSKKWWQKAIIMAGGPMMNVLIAVVLFGVVLMGFGTYVGTTTVAAVPNCVIPVEEQRDVCESGDAASPAKAADLRVGDRILAFDGAKVDTWDQLSARIRDAGAGPVSILVERGGNELTLRTDLIATERPSPEDSSESQRVGYLGIKSEQVKERHDVAAVFGQIGDYIVRTGEAMLHLPERMVGVARAVMGEERAQNSPMSVIGASGIAGEIAALEEPASDRIAAFVLWLAAVNLFLALFNFIPLLPLDGGHIAGALYEAIRRGVARVLGRPDPGPVDVAKLLPVAYVAASLMIVMGALTLLADIVNPVRISF